MGLDRQAEARTDNRAKGGGGDRNLNPQGNGEPSKGSNMHYFCFEKTFGIMEEGMEGRGWRLPTIESWLRMERRGQVRRS